MVGVAPPGYLDAPPRSPESSRDPRSPLAPAAAETARAPVTPLSGAAESTRAPAAALPPEAARAPVVPLPPPEWTVAITEQDQREMSTPDIVALYIAGTVTDDTFIWKEGMPDWLTPWEIEAIALALRAKGLPVPAGIEPNFGNERPLVRDSDATLVAEAPEHLRQFTEDDEEVTVIGRSLHGGQLPSWSSRVRGAAPPTEPVRQGSSSYEDITVSLGDTRSKELLRAVTDQEPLSERDEDEPTLAFSQSPLGQDEAAGLPFELNRPAAQPSPPVSATASPVPSTTIAGFPPPGVGLPGAAARAATPAPGPVAARAATLPGGTSPRPATPAPDSVAAPSVTSPSAASVAPRAIPALHGAAARSSPTTAAAPLSAPPGPTPVPVPATLPVRGPTGARAASGGSRPPPASREDNSILFTLDALTAQRRAEPSKSAPPPRDDLRMVSGLQQPTLVSAPWPPSSASPELSAPDFTAPPRPGSGFARPRRRWPWVVLVVLVLLAAAAAAAYYLRQPRVLFDELLPRYFPGGPWSAASTAISSPAAEVEAAAPAAIAAESGSPATEPAPLDAGSEPGSPPDAEAPSADAASGNEPAAAATAPFNKAAANEVLYRAAFAAGRCKKPGHRGGSGRVNVTFGNDGKVSQVELDGTLARSDIVDCVKQAYGEGSVPPYAGPTESISRNVRIE